MSPGEEIVHLKQQVQIEPLIKEKHPDFLYAFSNYNMKIESCKYSQNISKGRMGLNSPPDIKELS
jgi:hypothetical protein